MLFIIVVLVSVYADSVECDKVSVYLIIDEFLKFLPLYPHLVGAQLCRFSPVDAHTVALKPVMGK